MSWSHTMLSVAVLVIGLSPLTGCCVHRCGSAGANPMFGGAAGDCGCGGPCTGACGEAVIHEHHECGDTCGPPCGGIFSPITYFMGCGSGCGEIYTDEWLSDPPDCCDPCDNCGNWVGPPDSCRWHCFPLHFGNLWGTRHVAHGTAYAPAWQGDVVEGETVVDEQWSDEMVAPEDPSEEEEVAEPELEEKPRNPQTRPQSARSRSVLRNAPR